MELVYGKYASKEHSHVLFGTTVLETCGSVLTRTVNCEECVFIVGTYLNLARVF